jgi:hypothetical protein
MCSFNLDDNLQHQMKPDFFHQFLRLERTKEIKVFTAIPPIPEIAIHSKNHLGSGFILLCTLTYQITIDMNDLVWWRSNPEFVLDIDLTNVPAKGLFVFNCISARTEVDSGSRSLATNPDIANILGSFHRIYPKLVDFSYQLQNHRAGY